MEHWGFKMATNYIYKYVRNNEIIYIGKTKNLLQRHKQHLQEIGKFLETDKLYYFICPTSNIMDVYETALINKYHPMLNKADNILLLTIDIQEPHWTLYKENIIDIPPKSKPPKKEFQSKTYDNIFNNQYINNIELPLLSSKEWHLLLSMSIKGKPITTLEFLKLNKLSCDGDSYCTTRRAATLLQDKNLCNVLEHNLFDITQLGQTYTPYNIEEMLKMLGFRSKYSFWLYPSIKNKLTISMQCIRDNTGYTDARDIRKNIIEIALEQYNTIFFEDKRILQKNKKGRCIDSITFVES